jgi:hypothetical protein
MRLSKSAASALATASERYHTSKSELVRTLVFAAASEAAPKDPALVRLDRTTSLQLVRNVRSLGYLLNQCTRALNGRATAARTRIFSRCLESRCSSH